MANLGVLVVSLALLCAVPLAWAGPNAAAAAAYASGQFETAVEIAGRARDSETLALAARASLAQAITGDRANVDPLIARAISFSTRALEADPDSVEPRLHLAMALGMKGRRASIRDALRHEYARKGKRLIDEALDRAPNEPWAYALLGGWHLEIVRRGGSAGAAFYGARVASGRTAFDRALRLAPDDGAIAYQYALALIELDGKRFAREADALLARVQTWKTTNAFEARVRAQALRVRSILAIEGPAAAARAATRGLV